VLHWAGVKTEDENENVSFQPKDKKKSIFEVISKKYAPTTGNQSSTTSHATTTTSQVASQQPTSHPAGRAPPPSPQPAANPASNQPAMWCSVFSQLVVLFILHHTSQPAEAVIQRF
jgi:hypothetical protein